MTHLRFRAGDTAKFIISHYPPSRPYVNSHVDIVRIGCQRIQDDKMCDYLIRFHNGLHASCDDYQLAPVNSANEPTRMTRGK